ncbi:MAG: polysaccharide biosynthesis protein [Dehalococcoidales bacterium]|nr:polysaccharide biosynthesis protein [Dehalococcoidales bacterium]
MLKSEIISYLRKFLSDTILIVTSKERLRQVWHTPFYRNTYYLLSGTVINAALGFIFWVVAAKLYTADVIGLGSAVISAYKLLGLIAELGLAIGLVRFLPSIKKYGNEMINTCLTISGLMAVFISLIFLSGLGVWSPALLPVRQQPLYFVIFIIFTCSAVLQTNVLFTFLAKRETKYVFITHVATGALGLILLIAFGLLFSNSLSIMSASGLPIAFTLLMGVFWFLPKVQRGYRPVPMIKISILKELGKYSLVNFISKGLIQCTTFLLPLIVVNTLGAEMNAYFYVAWSIAVVLQLIPSSISNALFAEASSEESTLRTNTIKSLKLVLLLLLPSALVIAAAASLLLLIFGRDYTENGAVLLRILAFGVIPWGVIYVYIGIARVKKNSLGLIMVPLLSTGLSLVLSYILMAQMGLVGVGLGYLIGQSAVAVPLLLYLWRSRHSWNDRPARTENSKTEVRNHE